MYDVCTYVLAIAICMYVCMSSIGSTIIVYVLYDDIPDSFAREALWPQPVSQAPYELTVVGDHSAERSAAESGPQMAQEEGSRRVAVLLLRPLLGR